MSKWVEEKEQEFPGIKKGESPTAETHKGVDKEK